MGALNTHNSIPLPSKYPFPSTANRILIETIPENSIKRIDWVQFKELYMIRVVINNCTSIYTAETLKCGHFLTFARY